MRGRSAALAAVALAGLACGGRGPNGRACEAWVSHVNGMECLDVEYDVDNLCDGVDDLSTLGGDPHTVDLQPWFACLRSHVACGRASAVAACAPPSETDGVLVSAP